MCKEMLVFPVDRVVEQEKNNQKKWRTEAEEKHKGLLTKKTNKQTYVECSYNMKKWPGRKYVCFDF
jgi:hypothetical protein